MEEMARAGITDPVEISARLHSLRQQLPAEGGSTHLQQVVSATDASDQRLQAAGASARPARAMAAPRSAPALPEPEPAPMAASESEDEGRTA